MALLLRAKGIERVRPLDGGLDEWRRLGYPRATVAGVGAVGPPVQDSTAPVAEA